ncbi:hypothetical protein GLOIN_2v1654661 [Rhizophagus irregularis DAOM 181602=DAOM 197198]|uniref:Crinkler effector protein N-terminal domain-containing protein n=1 Tax=Rhizophagus irregularis (strain DAOM 181602 / DAOM 197198 / MUCL 43194) TaxID=747089 RepID=A0A2P4PMQ8_RHIID|nr:hypothetical protein GLOIN_2v1654661 [Rhizophagus irregularis DAOM 181602=DAOM 197198]POG66683.1 hypothetical protein GLOIN_2v1654661 [Rhizophagus irregularis DAOM 181602=DAOM 197198]|eukprot:XP_025173549.1 hypothetical protein GLOIN_2v1654661 [Rhizophagus irregularis DAOM 181602=DAOM 197198]
MRSVNINCLVLGMPFRNIISIKIKENETIGELKRRIKAEKDYFETAGASDLRLWRTNTRIGSSNAIPSFDLSDSNEILSYFQIKDIWKEDPPKSNLHVVVKIEVHCKTIYKKAIYDKHEKQFQRKITYAMVTLVKWKGKFANISQEFKNNLLISIGHMMKTFEDN